MINIDFAKKLASFESPEYQTIVGHIPLEQSIFGKVHLTQKT